MARPIKFLHAVRFSYWLVTAYVKKHVLFIAIGLLIGIIAGLKLPGLLSYLLKNSQTERIGLIGNYTLKNLPLDIQKQISIGLTVSDDSGAIKPGSAIAYEIKENGKKYIFHLKKRLFWHDGKDFLSSDVNYQFKDVKVSRKSDYLIEFELSKPFSPFPSLVAQPLFRQGLIGIGDFKVENYFLKGKFLTKLILFSDSHKIIYKFYPTEKEAIIGYKLGEVNSLLNLKNIEPIEKWPKTKIEKIISYDQYVGLFFNTKKGPGAEKSIRQALNYALEDSKINGVRAYSPISPLSWAYNQNVKTYEYNLDSAIKLLNKDSLAADSAEITLKLTVIKPCDQFLEAIVNSWKKIGIEVRTEITVLVPERFEVLLAAQEIPIDPDQYLMWHSTSRLNITGYNSPRIDKLLEDGRQLINESQRQEKYLEFQKYLVEDSPVIFLYFPTAYNINRL